MASLLEDQAAGLRKLFAGARGPARIAFAGAPEDAALAAALARGLAAAGKDVLVIDEQAGAEGVAARFGLRSRYDLLQAVNRDVPAAQVLLRPEPSIRLLPAARAARQQARLGAMERQALAEWLRRLQKGADFVLLAAAERAGAAFSPLMPQPERIVVAISPGTAALTEAYARIKRLALQSDRRRFDVALLGAAGAVDNRVAFANLREVARRHLGVELVPIDGAAGGDAGAVGRTLAESLLDASRGMATSGRAAAGRSVAMAHPVV